MYKPFIFFSEPTFVFYLMKLPNIVCMGIYCMIRKRNYRKYLEHLRYVNEIRKVCKAHGECDKKGNWNIKCSYKISETKIKVRVRFMKIGKDITYENFRTEVSCYTLNTTQYIFKKGWGYFELYENPLPIKSIKTDYHKISIGNGIDGIVMWDFDIYSCCLIAGKPRNGKTVEMLYILNGLIQARYDIWLIDGKVVDYYVLRKHFNYYIQNKDLLKVCEFINDFHNAMEERYIKMEQLNINNYRKADDMSPVFLICDEYLSVIDRAKKELKKVDYDNLIYLLGDIIRRGPASGYQVVLSMQRADTTYIVGEMRANIQLKIVVGNGGEELYNMMFDDKDLPPLPVGNAWYQQGDTTSVLAIPYYEDIEV